MTKVLKEKVKTLLLIFCLVFFNLSLKSVEIIVVENPVLGYEIKDFDYIEENLSSVDIKKYSFEGDKGKEIINRFKVARLPFVLIKEEIEKEKKFEDFKKKGLFSKKEYGYYILNSSFTYTNMYLNRKEMKGRIDIFLKPFDVFALNVALNFLLIEDKFKSTKMPDEIKNVKLYLRYLPIKDVNLPEIEEELRQRVIQEYFPQKFKKYLWYRIQKIGEYIFWRKAAELSNIDTKKLLRLMYKEGRDFLEGDWKLAEELNIDSSGIILVGNRIIYRLNFLKEMLLRFSSSLKMRKCPYKK